MSISRDMGPELERLLAETRERAQQALLRRERATYAGFTGAFLLAAGGLALLAHADRALDPLLALLLVLAYAVVARVEFAAGAGIVVPTQVVFVPMLLLLPTPLVPLLVAVALAFTDAVGRVVQRAAGVRARARRRADAVVGRGALVRSGARRTARG
jgi:hypothetical protein